MTNLEVVQHDRRAEHLAPPDLEPDAVAVAHAARVGEVGLGRSVPIERDVCFEL